MRTKSEKGNASRILEKSLGGPLTLARALWAIRKCEAWSLADMAKKLNVTKSHVAAIEKGKPVSPECAARYAKTLGYSPEHFVKLTLQDAMRRAKLPYVIHLALAS